MIPQDRHAWRSLAGGELSEEMFGRADLPRNSIGMKRCYNAEVTPQGSVQNRAGSKFITTTNGNNPAWLVPFVRADGQGFLLEFGDAYIRVVGAGNIVNEEPDPGNTYDVTDVNIWTPPDGATITPVVFTTGTPHGFVVGDAIRFQGFTLVNPDQAGNNILQSFMDTTWYVYKVPTSTTFQIIAYPPTPTGASVTANLNFENGNVGWTHTGGGSRTIDTDSPVQAGVFSLKLGVTSNPNGQSLTSVTQARFTVIPGQFVDASVYIYGNTGGPAPDAPIITRGIQWYNSSGIPISSTQAAFIHTYDTEDTFTQYTISGTAPAGAASFAPYTAAAWGDGAWVVDSWVIDYDAQMWQQFSYAPYNGLVTGGTVALAANTNPVVLVPSYTQSHIRFASFAQFVDDLVIAHNVYPTAKVSRASDNSWSFAALTFNNTLAAPAGITAAAQGTPGTPAITYRYNVTAVNDDGAESATGTEDTADNTLRTLGNFNNLSWSAVTDTFRYNIYKGVGAGTVYGFIGSADGLAFTDDNINPDLTKQPPFPIADFNAAGEYAGTVAFHEQRMILGGSLDEPQTFWASGLPAFDYFKASVPPQDDQAFSFELSSKRAAPIRHALASAELLFFTSSGVQRVIPVETELFTPTTIGAKVASSFGAHELAKPQEAGTNVLYPLERGGHLYQLEPADTLSGYKASDLSIIAAHLIDKYDWVQTAFRNAPFPVWYGLRNDGLIICLTYMAEEKVFAWYQFELPGAVVESIAVVPEGDVDSLYVIARRTILDQTVRYIERIEPRDFGGVQADAFFVDSGITYRGERTDTITGLGHLEGEEVMVLADGEASGPYLVESGEIVMDLSALVVHAGLGYTTQIETAPLQTADVAGFGLGIMKNVSQIWLRLKESLGLTAGVSFDEIDQRPLVDDAEEELGDVPALRDGVHDIVPMGAWSADTTICLQQTLPLPFTLTGMAIDYTEG